MNQELGLITVFLIAIALGMDAFSLSIGIGMQGVSSYQTGQLCLTVGVLHILLPLVGIFLGQALGTLAGDIAAYVGAAVLVILGAKMIYEEFTTEEEENIEKLSGWQFIVLPLSVSLDSLSIGFSLGTFGVQKLIFVTGIFGIVAAAMTLAGIFLGFRLGHFIEKTSIFGGGILVALGLKMLFF
ncbi:hypothetical protein BBF96_11770 [Anoxybacter fermentans]|uniref:Manganese efflux pump MntP n=1 Tax=Anoxybacter fermentans TaxID=1323375 RepID=A0A3Q9HRM8_9FIRM|nr:manganese efflux pump [Anoxybacter fermentans]AZR74010.1 hypothetical protein BBF96_11770 [Anoxybacter fermentans]